MTTAPTPSELAAWSELAKKTESRPWFHFEGTCLDGIGANGDPDAIVHWVGFENATGRDEFRRPNADYIVAACNNLPRLLSAYSQSQARVAELEAAIRAHRDQGPTFEMQFDFDERLWSVLPQSEGASDV